MKCPNCGYENKEDAVYCHVCSAGLQQGRSEPVRSPDSCKNHPEIPAKWVCEVCHNSFCDDCIKVRSFGSDRVEICNECGGRIVRRPGSSPYRVQGSSGSYSSGPQEMQVDPVVAGLLSFFMIGCGQAYNGLRTKGYFFFAVPFIMMVGIASLASILRGPFLILNILSPFAVLGFHIYNICDAYSLAKNINKGLVLSDTEGGRSALKFVLVIIGIVIIISLLFILGIFSLGSFASYMAGCRLR